MFRNHKGTKITKTVLDQEDKEESECRWFILTDSVWGLWYAQTMRRMSGLHRFVDSRGCAG